MSTGHPGNFGFVQCCLCETWRPAEAIHDGHCKDYLWCHHAEYRTWDWSDRPPTKPWHPSQHSDSPTGFDANGSEAP